jgi:hypothetical protein
VSTVHQKKSVQTSINGFLAQENEFSRRVGREKEIIACHHRRQMPRNAISINPYASPFAKKWKKALTQFLALPPIDNKG